MTPAEFLFLVLAGVAGGLFGSVAGLASLATYPALLATGLPPITANVTNTVALVFSGVGSVAGSRPELAGQGPRIRSLAPVAVLGGVTGAALLLTTPAEQFEKAVPILLGLASATILIPRRRRAAGSTEEPTPTRRKRVLESVAVFAIAIYGGYFGAAAGVLMFALFLQTTRASLPRANAAKNVLLGLANIVAAVGFAVFAPVDWLAALPLATGCLVGSRIGPIIVRRAPATVLRIVIGTAGIALAVKLGTDAWSGT